MARVVPHTARCRGSWQDPTRVAGQNAAYVFAAHASRRAGTHKSWLDNGSPAGEGGLERREGKQERRMNDGVGDTVVQGRPADPDGAADSCRQGMLRRT
jgi:hypothetical protein